MPRRLLPLALLITACQEPFAVQRKDLGPFRIAALGVEDGRARAAIWSGLGAWHEARPRLEWSLDGAPLGEGFEVEVPGGGELGLRATSAEGEVRQARLSVGTPPPAFEVERLAVTLGEDLSLEARREAATSPVETSAPADAAMRLALRLEEAAETDLALRWMSAGGRGTLLEVEALAADVLAEEVVFEDGAVASREESGPGIYTQLALLQDGRGGNRWAWIDAAIGVEEPLLHHEHRLLALDAATHTGLLAVTLEAREDPWGLAPVDPEPVTDLSAQEALDCAPAGEPFRLAWVVEGRCARPEVLGARVVLEVR